MFVVGTQTA